MAIAAQAPAPASAESTLFARITQGFQADTNIDLSPNSSGDVYILSPSVDAGIRTRTQSYEAFVDAGASLSLATGAGETSDLDSVNPRINAGFTLLGQEVELRADGYLRLRPVSFAETESLTDPSAPPSDPTVTPPASGGGDAALDVTSARAQQLDFGAGFGASWRLDPTSSLGARTYASARRFSSTSGAAAGELVESDTFGATLAYSRRVTQTTDLGLSLSGSIFDPKSGATDLSKTLTLLADAEVRLTPRHTGSLSGGVSFVDSSRSAAFGGNDETQIGFVGAAGLAYALNDFNAAFQVSQSIEPSSLGELQNQTAVSLLLSHAVNERLQIGLFGSAAIETALSGSGAGATDRFLATVSPNLRYSLTPDASLSIGYRFRYSDQEAQDSAISNAVFLTISHNFEGRL